MEPNHTRLILFTALLLFFSLLQLFYPLRSSNKPTISHTFVNLSLIAIATLLIQVFQQLMQYKAISININIGLLSHVSMPDPLQTMISLMLLDVVIYWQHRWSHSVPLLWRLHQVHHSDHLLDTSTGVRFHPIEIIASQAYQWGWVLALGIRLEDFLLFQLLLSAFPLFNHSNLKLPYHIEKWLAYVVVTPRYHEIHHSDYVKETNSNYGFFMSIWDCIFRSQRTFNTKNQIKIGLDYLPKSQLSLKTVLRLPFVSRQTMANPK